MNSIEENIQKTIVDFLNENNRLLVLLTEMSSISHNLMAKKTMLKDGGNHWQNILSKIEDLDRVAKKVDENDLIKRYQGDFDFLLDGWTGIRRSVVKAAKTARLEIPSECSDAEVPSNKDCEILCGKLGELASLVKK